VDACLLSSDTRAELHALLSRHLSNSFQQAMNEDELASRTMAVNRVFVDRYKSRGRELPNFRNHRQTILCSATIPQRQHFATQCYKNGWTETVPRVIHPEQGMGLVPQHVVHEYVTCALDQQVSLVIYLLERERKRWLANREKELTVSVTDAGDAMGFQAICFTEDVRVAERLHGRLSSLSRDTNRMGGCAMLDARAGLVARAKAMADYRAGASASASATACGSGSSNADMDTIETPVPVEVLVASPDLAARGLDLPGTSTVILMDLPSDVSGYVHCAGRAGRLGREGRVITLLREGQKFVLERFSNELGVPITRREVKSSSSKGEEAA